jgi:5-oxoprolinase (ATP-hydrolysing) subunit C
VSAIAIEKVMGLSTVQDLGRIGHMAEAVPRGGALSRRLMQRANAAVGNAETAAVIEVLGRLMVRGVADVTVATERWDVTMLRAGDALTIEPDPSLRVRYLAVAGGLRAPVVLGSCSALTGCFGLVLRGGERLETLGEPVSMPRMNERRSIEASAIRVVPGPDEPGSFAALIASRWRIDTRSDRRGTRLTGEPIDVKRRDLLPSSPMAPGAVQLPAGGSPIVVGPDGPTTGGYPIVGVILRADLDRFHELPLRANVAFVDANLG